jgi:formimidoylglutamate deiminase
VVVLDDEHPAIVGREGDAALDAWLFAGDDTPVRDVMVGGAWVVRNGRHERAEPIADRYREVARRLARDGPRLAVEPAQ